MAHAERMFKKFWGVVSLFMGLEPLDTLLTILINKITNLQIPTAF